jgi:hypothetical protein
MMRTLPRWRTIAGIAILALAVSLVPGYALTNATWTEQEYDFGTITTLQCAGNTDLTSRATSRFLYGTVGGQPLDSVAGVTGIVVTNNGTTQSASAGTPGAVVSGTGYSAPLSASAINSAVLAGTAVSLPLTWPTGAYAQYARALDTGSSTSGSGAVGNSGAIDAGAPGLAPSVGSLSLSTLPGIGTTLGNLTNVALTVGAVASSASLDGCSHAWRGGAPTSAELDRNYLLSSLTATATSPSVAALFSGAGSVAGLVRADLDGEFGTNLTSGEAETAISASGLGALTGAVSTGLGSSLLGPVKTALALLGVSLSVNGSSASQVSSTVISVDLAPVTTLLSSTVSDGVVAVNLANGQITVDIGALSGGLEGRAANTELLTDAQVLDISARVNTLLRAQIAAVRTALTTALNAATVTVSLTVIIKAGSTDVISVHLGYAGTLKQFVDGTSTTPLVTITGPQVAILGSGLIQNTLASTGAVGLLTTVLGTLSSVTTTVLDTAQAEAYDELLGTQLDTVLASATALETTALSVLSPLIAAIGTLLSITLNAQPDQPNATGTPSGSPQPDEFFVSSLHLSAVNGVSLLDLWLATSSVGPNAT